MDGRNHRMRTTTGLGSATDPAHVDEETRSWVNWVLALLTVPGAAIVMLYTLGAVMSADGGSTPSASCATARRLWLC